MIVFLTKCKNKTGLILDTPTVNPRITPRGLIYQQINFGWGLIRAGGLLI